MAEGQEYPPAIDQNWIESTEKRAQTKVYTLLMIMIMKDLNDFF